MWPATDAEKQSPAGKQVKLYEKLLQKIGEQLDQEIDPDQVTQTAITIRGVALEDIATGLTRLDQIQQSIA